MTYLTVPPISYILFLWEVFATIIPGWDVNTLVLVLCENPTSTTFPAFSTNDTKDIESSERQAALSRRRDKKEI